MEAVAQYLQPSYWPLYLLLVPIVLTIYSTITEHSRRGASVSDALHTLRDQGAKQFVAQLEYKLKKVAASGRSDYEFNFRKYDVWIEYKRIFLFFTLPVPTSYWDCIDSPGSREVVKKMLEGEGKGLRVDWCISSRYPKDPFAPKWVLSCQWDRLDLRKNQYGGR